MPDNHTDVSIVLAGEAGQGVQTVERLLVRLAARAGLHVFATKEVMSRIRGGVNSTELRVGTRPVRAFVDRIDVFIPLVNQTMPHLQRRIGDETLILAETSRIDIHPGAVDVPLTAVAEEVGKALYSNSVALGLIAGLLEIDAGLLGEVVGEHFSAKGGEIAEANREAARRGRELGRGLVEDGRFSKTVTPDGDKGERLLLNGTRAVALGALAGGCNYCCAYPMSPSTGVLVELAARQDELPLVVEQVEDEIAAVNMAAGAAATGARPLVTTSGGGLALMSEGLSVIGNMELPLVLHCAQRPGPATGLPTRSEQGDLNLALHAGHGDFARVVLAPGNIEEAYRLTHHAFDLALRYQIPVILLTDQYLVDSFHDLGELPELESLDDHIVKTKADYRRYAYTESGVSPRGVYGHGAGFVRSDSHTHDQDGHISEDLHETRPRMVEKQLLKLEGLQAEALEPVLHGPRDYQTLLITWGSTLEPAREALENTRRDDVALLHFPQLYPLPLAALEYLGSAERLICLEGNATGQFADLLLRELGFAVDEKLLKYNGLAFTVEDVADLISDL
ncbi:MAG: 2-oxoacid:acceptor oxidoreductase subunit alpha [Candidatus Coatesbacteria bacterium]|nr:2-oxoacid:acceptor oxidoreductase subunit alpha [Candidatus Coatesbacteria bacterium]